VTLEKLLEMNDFFSVSKISSSKFSPCKNKVSPNSNNDGKGKKVYRQIVENGRKLKFNEEIFDLDSQDHNA
jgi:hypothetical protein